MSSICWDVYLDNELIDSVWFDCDMEEWQVLDSLINHDGYNQNIVVEKSK